MGRFILGVVILTVVGLSSSLRYRHKNHGTRNLHETSEMRSTIEKAAPVIKSVENKETEDTVPIGVDKFPPNLKVPSETPAKEEAKPIEKEESKEPTPEILPVPSPLTEVEKPTENKPNEDNKEEDAKLPAATMVTGQQSTVVTPAIVIGSFDSVSSNQGDTQGTIQKPVGHTPIQPMNDFITVLMNQLSPLGYMFNKPFQFQQKPQTLNNKPVNGIQALTPQTLNGVSNKPSTQSVLLALMSPQGNFISSNSASSSSQLGSPSVSVDSAPNTKLWPLPWDVKPMTFPQAINVIFPTCRQQCEADNKIGLSDDSPCLNFNCNCPVFGQLAKYTQIGGKCDDGTCNVYCKKPYKKIPNVPGTISLFPKSDNSTTKVSEVDSKIVGLGVDVELGLFGDKFQHFGFEYLHGGKCELHAGYQGSEVICVCKCLMGDKNLPYIAPMATTGPAIP